MSGKEGLFGSEGVDAAPPGAAGLSPAGLGSRRTSAESASAGRAPSEPFDAARLRGSVERARLAAGKEDPALVDEVVDIVMFSLPGDGERRPAHVDPEEVGRMVERTLVELGQVEVAREFILARDRRSRAREVLRESKAGVGFSHLENPARLPVVEGRDGSRPFEPGRVASGLVEEAGLGAEQAMAVAARVEVYLGGTALRRVTGGLVRELVNHALLEAGLESALRQHEAVGVPRRELTAALRGSRPDQLDRAPGPCAWSDRAERRAFDEASGEALIERWALQDVLGSKSAEAHRRADLHVLGAAAPHRVLTRSVSAELLGGGDQSSRSGAFQLVRRVALTLRDAGRGLYLEDVAGALASVVEPGGASFERREAPAVDLLQSLGAAAEASGRSLGLARFGGKRGVAAGRLIRCLRRAVVGGGAAVQLYATLPEVEDAVAAAPRGDVRAETQVAAEGLLRSGHLVPVWAPDGLRWVGPGCNRGRRERGALAVASAVAINLPRLARAAGPWREERFLQLLLERVATAVEASAAMARFQGEARQRHGDLLSARAVHVLAPVGLHEAMRILGDGAAKADQGALVLGVLRDAGARLGKMADLQVEISGALQRPAAERFAGADAPGEGPTQARLFEDMPRPEAERMEAYGGLVAGLDGEDLGATREGLGRARGLAALFETSPAGGLFPGAGDGTRPSGPEFVPGPASGSAGRESAETPRFELWRQFYAHRGAGPDAGSGEGGKSLF